MIQTHGIHSWRRVRSKQTWYQSYETGHSFQGEFKKSGGRVSCYKNCHTGILIAPPPHFPTCSIWSPSSSMYPISSWILMMLELAHLQTPKTTDYLQMSTPTATRRKQIELNKQATAAQNWKHTLPIASNGNFALTAYILHTSLHNSL